MWKNKAFMERKKEVLSERSSTSHFTTVVSKEMYTLTLHLKECCMQCDKKSGKDLADLQVQALESADNNAKVKPLKKKKNLPKWNDSCPLAKSLPPRNTMQNPDSFKRDPLIFPHRNPGVISKAILLLRSIKVTINVRTVEGAVLQMGMSLSQKILLRRTTKESLKS